MTSVRHDAGIGVDRGYLVDRRHRAGPTGGRRGDDAGAAVAQVELRAPTAISTSVSTAVRLLDGQEFGRPGPPSTRATAR
jgi:hypothetical protein